MISGPDAFEASVAARCIIVSNAFFIALNVFCTFFFQGGVLQYNCSFNYNFNNYYDNNNYNYSYNYCDNNYNLNHYYDSNYDYTGTNPFLYP